MPVSNLLIPGYQWRAGSSLERALLLKFLQRTYKEVYPKQDFSHLAMTVEQYFCNETPLWWVEVADPEGDRISERPDFLPSFSRRSPVGCLWLGNVVDQVKGDRHSHIFMVYVKPNHRRQGIGSALLEKAENWARERGDRQISLQVFLDNENAINLYKKFGYEPYSLLMQKPL